VCRRRARLIYNMHTIKYYCTIPCLCITTATATQRSQSVSQLVTVLRWGDIGVVRASHRRLNDGMRDKERHVCNMNCVL
jgi:hypothetical protein